MIEVTFKINGGDSEESLHRDKAAIDGFFNGLLGTELKVVKGTVEETDDDEPEEKPAPKKRTRRTKAQIAADKAKAEAAKKAEEDSDDDEPEEDSDDDEPEEDSDDEISFEELSTVVADKVKELKDAGKNPAGIVKKLKALGAKKLDDLDESKYGKLLEYVETL